MRADLGIFSTRVRFLAAAAAFAISIGVCGSAGAYHIYYANLHSHTSYSDGIGTPAEAYAYAREVAEIQVLGLTDHTSQLSATEWTDEQNAANANTQDGVFVALYAQEFGNLNDFGHLGIYDSIYRNPNNTENLLGTYQFMKDMGAIGNFNHPSWGTNFDNLAFYPAYVEQMVGCEVRNGFRSGNYEPQYIQALQNGWHVGPLGNQDNHEGQWGDQGNPNQNGAIYLTGVLADTLTKQAILSAFRARRFYAMEIRPPSDRLELSFTANGAPMGSTITSSAYLALAGSARGLSPASLFNRADLFEDGVIVDYRILLGNSVTWQFDRHLMNGESHYYFVRARQVDGDYAWSAPIWVTCQLSPTDIEAESAARAGLFTLHPAFPNPASGPTNFSFRVPDGSPRSIDVTIHDLTGRRIDAMGTRELAAGEHSWAWDPAGSYVSAPPRITAPRPAAGIYFARLIADGKCVGTRRFVLLQ
jgi:hypothetical protein